jgi:hypothetical protein
MVLWGSGKVCSACDRSEITIHSRMTMYHWSTRVQCMPTITNSSASGSIASQAPVRRCLLCSTAKQARRLLCRAAATDDSKPKKPKVAVVGAGWAGFGAAYALVEAGADVVVLDAAEHPGGLSTAWKTSKGQVVEPGIKGFWYQYANIESLVKKLGIDPFTEWTRSSFWAPDGLQVSFYKMMR